MKWTRQRCQEAPTKTLAMAAFSPRWWSETTSSTPAEPRSRRLWRNSVQKAPSSESPMARPSTSRSPVSATPVATTTARDTTRPATRAFT